MALINNIPHGLSANVANFEITESVSITNRADKTVTLNMDGDTKSVVYYNSNGEFTATGLKSSAPNCTVGTLIAIGDTGADSEDSLKAGFTGVAGATGGALTGALVFVSELTLEQTNEDYQRYTVKGNLYKGITTTV